MTFEFETVKWIVFNIAVIVMIWIDLKIFHKREHEVGVKESLVRSSEQGVMSFDTALFDLFKQGKVTLEEAISNADSRTNLEARINFG
mgnify:CR=1 FL=1